MITKEFLQARLADLRSRLEHVRREAITLDGAAQDCEVLLAEIQRQEDEPEVPDFLTLSKSKPKLRSI
ncbi:hypothetical protein LCGC14_0470750 [marine sediment metagenome]|uniref:Uncharacterized protein n=1 Tax=marine sediment metagenome TaxID=412755 RepID=A0A0F9UZ63_9ZZZZ